MSDTLAGFLLLAVALFAVAASILVYGPEPPARVRRLCRLRRREQALARILATYQRTDAQRQQDFERALAYNRELEARLARSQMQLVRAARRADVFTVNAAAAGMRQWRVHGAPIFDVELRRN